MPTPPDIPAIQRRLGRAVKSVRSERGITQEELSRRTGLHPTYVSDVERGARNPSFAVLVRIADGLGVTLAELGSAYDRLQDGGRSG
jgi:transcriptional regulator with XRE-family HTH domain